MKNFIVFLSCIFFLLFLAVFFKSNRQEQLLARPTLRVFASTSFISQWGPGPWLRQEFEKICECRIEFIDASDSVSLFQRLRAKGKNQSADVVFGFDQFDLEMIQQGLEWLPLSLGDVAWLPEVKPYTEISELKPYNWSPLSFVFKISKVEQMPKRVEDLLSPEFSKQLALQDPRMSSPGLQLLLWLVSVKGEERAFEFLRKFSSSVHSYSASWSASEGIFRKQDLKGMFSYFTSPIYYLNVEKTQDYAAVDFEEGVPRQFEFVGVPATCTQCELAQQFVRFVYTVEAQRKIMEQNSMLPVVSGVIAGTNFEKIVMPRFAPVKTFSQSERERLIQRWSALRRAQ
jgi:thiamine transport system substrate-binding protein